MYLQTNFRLLKKDEGLSSIYRRLRICPFNFK